MNEKIERLKKELEAAQQEERDRRRSERAKQMEIEKEKRSEHKKRLEEEHGISGHPKADTLYEIAWSYGHSSGFDEVTYHYAEMADLLSN